MSRDIDDFIKNICDNECGDYFESSKEHTFTQIKESLPTFLFFKREVEIRVARVSSAIIKRVNKIDKNRFWILYYRLSDKLINMKCNQSNLSTANEMMCIEYILDRVLNQIKTFDVRNESPPFQQTRANISQIDKIYNRLDNLRLDIDSKQLKENNKIAIKYTNKILKTYTKNSLDIETIGAIIENAILSMDVKNPKPYQKRGESSYIEREVLSHCNNSKDEINKILHPLLIELLHQEKFFNFIYNSFINSRFIDFIRTIKELPVDESPIYTSPIDEILNESNILSSILDDYLEMIPKETQLILKLKIGEQLDNKDFIKLIYSFNYRDIDILGYFENEEILEIKFYTRNNIDISCKTNRKISQIREKLKANSYINRKDDSKRVALLKLIFSEEMSAKDIGLFLGYSDKQVYKKIESIKNKIKSKKRLVPCKEM